MSWVRAPLVAPVFNKKHQKMAEMLDQLIAEGEIEIKDFVDLIEKGLDQAAVECWYTNHLDKVFYK